MSPTPTRAPTGAGRSLRHARAQARAGELDTFVLVRVSWVVLALGLVAAALFAREPDPRAHPGLLLLAITGLVGTCTLRLLARLLRTPPHARRDDDVSSS